ncbi:isopentenyl-diphosphate Delta-isomerase [Kibdelosporangium philippinense]|uniref:Isopentenyl-diphosphate Delta-isomerase n=1 Tax=Kibdelosporangium philippinense TaxID=211113 RepID=A0ABS8ZD30_9PSEU|nr:isopentenyl-diphosphate Delta-isomerase [Kibdelosporangium philippinense]MCE7005751.1 isopentenyl-diphosphate Delta-isomerase [Kibdelosporangium philippinense]
MEQVVLLDEAGQAIGTADKATVHHEQTPLHLAFSSYVFDEQNRFLLTRRALSKRTWPGVWTNSCCGHPAPGEAIRDAVIRRLKTELGLDVDTIELVLPSFRYRVAMPDGVVENEMCPVYRVTVSDEPKPDPAEVEEFEWVAWPPVRKLSPWAELQLPQLNALGPDPRNWPAGDPSALPPAAN